MSPIRDMGYPPKGWLLNPIKGKTDVSDTGWTCDVAAQTLSSN